MEEWVSENGTSFDSRERADAFQDTAGERLAEIEVGGAKMAFGNGDLRKL